MAALAPIQGRMTEAYFNKTRQLRRYPLALRASMGGRLPGDDMTLVQQHTAADEWATRKMHELAHTETNREDLYITYYLAYFRAACGTECDPVQAKMAFHRLVYTNRPLTPAQFLDMLVDREYWVWVELEQWLNPVALGQLVRYMRQVLMQSNGGSVAVPRPNGGGNWGPADYAAFRECLHDQVDVANFHTSGLAEAMNRRRGGPDLRNEIADWINPPMAQRLHSLARSLEQREIDRQEAVAAVRRLAEDVEMGH
jgi:hypothetical protein